MQDHICAFFLWFRRQNVCKWRGKCSSSFHFHQAKDWPSDLETNMHSILGAFFNSALLLKYLDIFLQYITGNAFILFDVTMSLFVVNCVLFCFFNWVYFNSGSCLFISKWHAGSYYPGIKNVCSCQTLKYWCGYIYISAFVPQVCYIFNSQVLIIKNRSRRT